MRALAAVLGSEGDVVPFIALGQRLAERGHELVLAGFEDFATRVQTEGIDYLPLPGDCQRLMRRLLGDTKGVLDAVRGFREMMGEPAVFEALEGAMDGVDVVLHNQFTEMARLLSAAAGVPCLRVLAYPTEPGRRYSLVDPRRNDGSWRAAAWHRTSNLMMVWAMAPVMGAWRRRLGLSRFCPCRPDATLYQFSPTLSPPDPAWGERVHVTGEWLCRPQDPEHLDEKVEDFLGKGEAPLLVSFGSVASSQLARARVWVRELLVERRQRAIIVEPEHPRGEEDGLLSLARVPFEAVLGRCRGVISHGGVGTTGAALRAGVPVMTVAFGGDQQFHAQAVHRNGAGPAYIDAQRGELTRRMLAVRMDELLSGDHDEAARGLAPRLKAEQGVDEAVEVLLGLTAGFRDASEKAIGENGQ